MKLSADKLTAHLSGALKPAYLLTGDDPLLVSEAADAIRARARECGFTERDLHVAQRGFDWTNLSASGANLSLFAERRIVEVRLPTGKPGRDGGKAIADYMKRPPEDNLFLLVCPKLDRSGQSSAWAKAVEKGGALVQVWPVNAARLSQWIQGRMRAAGLEPTREAVQLLAGRTEGNLLAAAQEIDKLALLTGRGPVDEQAVRKAVADSARYDIFDLADAALAGSASRALHILEGLRGEGVEPVLVLWALGREIRSLASVCWQTDRGTSLSSALGSAGVWQSRRGLVGDAARRIGSGRRADALLVAAARADRIVKGAPGQPWAELTALVAGLCGVAAAGAAA